MTASTDEQLITVSLPTACYEVTKQVYNVHAFPLILMVIVCGIYLF